MVKTRSKPNFGRPDGRWHYAACPNPLCGSSDAFAWRENETSGHCFSCGHTAPLEEKGLKMSTATTSKPKAKTVVSKRDQLSVEDIQSQFSPGTIPERKIKLVISEHFKVLQAIDEDGETTTHYYPYTDKNGVTVAYKQRLLPKKFTMVGDAKSVGQLFGQSVAGGGKRLVITEGELDCLAVAQVQFSRYKKHYPVVSIPSASQVERLVLENREWIRSFPEVVLCTDNDEAGLAARTNLCKIIGYDRVRLAEYPEKDPCEVLKNRGEEALMQAIFDAKPYVPDGIITGEAVWEQFKNIRKVQAIPYPSCMEGVNKRLMGMRRGEIVLLVSGTGAGKSTLMKEILLELHSYEQSEEINKLGTLFLEESVGDTAEKLIGMHLQKNMQRHILSEKEERAAFEELFSDERLLLLDHQGSVEDDSIIDRIEYMALMGCTHIFLDHITIAVSDGMEGRSGNEAVDHLMSRLLKAVKRHNIWICVVSHLRKVDNKSKPFEQGRLPSLDDIKGSGSIKQISFDVLAFARDMTNRDERIRNTISLRVLKARKTGNTGDAGAISYDNETSRMNATDELDFNEEM